MKFSTYEDVLAAMDESVEFAHHVNNLVIDMQSDRSQMFPCEDGMISRSYRECVEILLECGQIK